MQILIKKNFVHGMGHMYHRVTRINHDYLGEAIIRTSFSNSLVALLDLPKALQRERIRVYIGQYNKRYKRVSVDEQGRILTGDVMNRIWMVAVTVSRIKGQVVVTRQKKPSNRIDPIFEFDLGKTGDPPSLKEGGFLRNLCFCPKRIRLIRDSGNPF